MSPAQTAGGDAAGSAAQAHKRVAIYILVRLLLGLALLVLASMTAESRPNLVAKLSGQFRLAAVLFLAMGVSAALLPRLGDHPLFAWSQLGIDTVFATALVSFTGGPVSPFFPLYFLNIVAAAWLLPPRGPLAVAGFDALAFVGILALRGGGLFDGSPLLMYSQITLQIFAFSLVGILSGLLSSNVRKAKAALAVQVRETQQLQARHDLVLDGIETGVLLISPEGTIASANASAQRVLGECAGEPLGAVLRSDQRRWAQTVVRDDEALRIECSRMTVAEGGEMVLIEDVTRLREMEEAIAREERLSAVGRLAASLAHEIRNPLASLSGSVQLMREGDHSPLHDIVLREVNRLNELVEDFLDTARPVRLDVELHDAREIVGEVIAAFRNDARYRGRRVLRTRAEAGIPPIRMDAARYRQVIWNLLLNAAEATADYGTIEVAVQHRGDSLVTTVKDDGVGIPPDALGRIFDPFYTTRSGGTGLGLANVDRVMRAHGGQASVSSEPGVGSEFRLVMPVAGPAISEGELRPGTEALSPDPDPQEAAHVG